MNRVGYSAGEASVGAPPLFKRALCVLMAVVLAVGLMPLPAVNSMKAHAELGDITTAATANIVFHNGASKTSSASYSEFPSYDSLKSSLGNLATKTVFAGWISKSDAEGAGVNRATKVYAANAAVPEGAETDWYAVIGTNNKVQLFELSTKATTGYNKFIITMDDGSTTHGFLGTADKSGTTLKDMKASLSSGWSGVGWAASTDYVLTPGSINTSSLKLANSATYGTDLDDIVNNSGTTYYEVCSRPISFLLGPAAGKGAANETTTLTQYYNAASQTYGIDASNIWDYTAKDWKINEKTGAEAWAQYTPAKTETYDAGWTFAGFRIGTTNGLTGSNNPNENLAPNAGTTVDALNAKTQEADSALIADNAPWLLADYQRTLQVRRYRNNTSDAWNGNSGTPGANADYVTIDFATQYMAPNKGAEALGAPPVETRLGTVTFTGQEAAPVETTSWLKDDGTTVITSTATVTSNNTFEIGKYWNESSDKIVAKVSANPPVADPEKPKETYKVKYFDRSAPVQNYTQVGEDVSTEINNPTSLTAKDHVNTHGDGWTLKGWVRGDNDTLIEASGSASVTSSTKDEVINLYAVWERDINLHINNASSLVERKPTQTWNTKTEASPAAATIPSVPAAPSQGWTALGWFGAITLSADNPGTPTVASGGGSYSGTDQDLYAVYSRNVTLSYYKNQDSVTWKSGDDPATDTKVQYYRAGTDVTNDPTSVSFTLKVEGDMSVGADKSLAGWSTDQAATSADYDTTATYTQKPAVSVSATLSPLYAVWTTPKFTIAYHDGTTTKTREADVNTSATATLASAGDLGITRSNWNPDGWTNSSGVTPNTTSMTKGKTYDVYAKWTRTLTVNGVKDATDYKATVTQTLTTYNGDTLTPSPSTELTAKELGSTWQFQGWVATNSSTTPLVTSNPQNYAGTETNALYAYYTRPVTLEFKQSSGTDRPTTTISGWPDPAKKEGVVQTYTFSGSEQNGFTFTGVTAPIDTSNAYSFAGWTTTDGGTDVAVSEDATTYVIATRQGPALNASEEELAYKLYDSWTANKYNVVFHGGTITADKAAAADLEVVDDASVTDGTKVAQRFTQAVNVQALTPTKGTLPEGSGWSFDGWVKKASPTKAETAVTGQTVGETIDLYAVWKRDVNLHLGVTDTDTLAAGTTYGSIGAETPAGQYYNFADDEKYSLKLPAAPDTKNLGDTLGWTGAGWAGFNGADATVLAPGANYDGAGNDLYAAYERTATLTYTKSADSPATSQPAASTAKQTYVSGGTAGAIKFENLASPLFTSDVYTFAGWFESTDGGATLAGDAHPAGSDYTVSPTPAHDAALGAYALYDKWTAATYTVNWYAGGQVVHTAAPVAGTATAASSYTIPAADLPAGWEFDRWVAKGAGVSGAAATESGSTKDETYEFEAVFKRDVTMVTGGAGDAAVETASASKQFMDDTTLAGDKPGYSLAVAASDMKAGPSDKWTALGWSATEGATTIDVEAAGGSYTGDAAKLYAVYSRAVTMTYYENAEGLDAELEGAWPSDDEEAEQLYCAGQSAAAKATFFPKYSGFALIAKTAGGDNYRPTGWKEAAGDPTGEPTVTAELFPNGYAADVALDADGTALYATWQVTEAAPVRYVVGHFKQQLDGTYPAQPDASDETVRIGFVGDEVQAPAELVKTAATATTDDDKAFLKGFEAGVADEPRELTEADAAAADPVVVAIRYARAKFEVTVEPATGGTTALQFAITAAHDAQMSTTDSASKAYEDAVTVAPTNLPDGYEILKYDVSGVSAGNSDSGDSGSAGSGSASGTDSGSGSDSGVSTEALSTAAAPASPIATLADGDDAAAEVGATVETIVVTVEGNAAKFAMPAYPVKVTATVSEKPAPPAPDNPSGGGDDNNNGNNGSGDNGSGSGTGTDTGSGSGSGTGTGDSSTTQLTPEQAAAAAMATADKLIAGMPKGKGDNEPDAEGALFSILPARITKAKTRSMTVAWSWNGTGEQPVYYALYGNKCGVKNKYQPLMYGTVASFGKGKTKKVTFNAKKPLKNLNTGKVVSKVLKNTSYKFVVMAFDANGNLLEHGISKTVHAFTPGKKGAVKKVTASKANVKLKAGKKTKVKLTIKHSKKKLIQHRPMKVEVVNKTGVVTAKLKANKKKVKSTLTITGKKKGTAVIYAFACDGHYKKIKVTVR